MSGLRDTVNRTNPSAGAGTTYFGILKYLALVDFDLNSNAGGPLNTERVSLQWGPLSFVKICAAQTALGDYPCETLDGTIGGTAVTITSNSGAVVTLSGTMTWDPTGLLIQVQNASGSTNDYTWYRIVAWNGSNQITLNRTPLASFSASDPFKFFIDCEHLNALFIKSEYSVSGATADLIPAFYDTGRTPAGTPAARPSMRFPSGIVTPANNGVNTDNTSGGYHGDAVSVNCAGAVGAKVRLHTAPTSGNISLWACAS
jgi:hypothetical protein